MDRARMTPEQVERDRERVKLWTRKYVAKRRVAGLCPGCGKRKPTNGMKACAQCRKRAMLYQTRSYKKDPSRFRQRTKKWFDGLKNAVFDHYGGRCACCGISERVFLVIDHVNEDGSKHRKKLGRSSMNLYRDIINRGFPDDLQILCHNCNWGKHVNHGICPHQT